MAAYIYYTAFERDDIMQKNEIMRLNPPSSARQHSAVMENREKISLTAVKSVESFNECEVVAITEAGPLTVFGSGLHITRLDLDSGHLWIEGMLGGIEYHQQSEKRGFFSFLKG